MENTSIAENAYHAKTDALFAQLPTNVLLALPNNSSATTSVSLNAPVDITEVQTESVSHVQDLVPLVPTETLANHAKPATS